MGERFSCICCCGQEERRVNIVKFEADSAEIDVWRNLFSQRRRHHSCDSSVSKSSSKKSTSPFQSESHADDSEDGEHEEEDDAENVDMDTSAAKPHNHDTRKRGTLWFKELKLLRDEGISANVLAELPKLSATITEIGERRWRVDGIQVEKFLNAGFFRLDRLLGREGIHDLPVNDAGKPLLLRESLIRDLLKGNRVIKSVPAADAAAAQRDLHNLSLRQLLHLKALNIDFAPGGNSVQATFLSVLSELIFERLGQKAADSDDATLVPSAKRLGRDIVLVVGAAKQLSVPHIWVVWFGDKRIFFHMARLACTDATGFALGEGGVLEFVERSEPDRTAGDGRLVLNLIVKHVTNETQLSPRVTTDTGSSASQAPLSQADVTKTLASLKKVRRD